MNNEYYNILGVNKNSSKEEIKKAYRKLSKKYHPDKKGGDEDKFKKINEAYSILGNDEKRRQYDLGGDRGDFFNAPPRGDGFFGNDFDNFFDMFFNRSSSHSSRNTKITGESVNVIFNVELKDIIVGTEKDLLFERKINCDECHGFGGEYETCTTCSGKGYKTVVTETVLGKFTNKYPCPTCRGSGNVIKKRCGKCNGNKQFKKKEKITIPVPIGVDSSMSFKVPHKGNDGINDGITGDLYITFEVDYKEYFRKGNDLYRNMNVDYFDLVLGNVIETYTPLGEKIKINVKEGTQLKTLLKISNKGVKNSGNLYLKINIGVPENLSNEEKERYIKAKNIINNV